MRAALLLTGILCPLIVVLVPPVGGLGPEAWGTAGVAAMMALWWMTGAVPLAATALMPLLLVSALGIGPVAPVAMAYFHPLLLLFLGGFLIGHAIERCGLHRRLGCFIFGLSGGRPDRLLGAIMLTTAFLSLWISNTSSAILMLPIAGSVIAARPAGDRLATTIMLGVAYGATIGGMGSLIGTPPNALFAAYVGQSYGVTIGFAQWASIGLPVAGVLLVLGWLVLARLTPGLAGVVTRDIQIGSPGPWRESERRVAMVAGLTATGLITRPFLTDVLPFDGLTDAQIAMTGASLLFVLPSGEAGRLLDFRAFKTLRWDLLILFGGGLALAGMIDRSGLAAAVGGQVTRLETWPVWLLLFVIGALIVYIGELASNTAMAAVFLPIGGAAALMIGADPVSFLLPIVLAASVGFMLPVATPPNALVMAHPAVTRTAMLKAGSVLDLVGLLVAVTIGHIMAGIIL